MKKTIALILSLALIISMAGCGKAAAETTAKTNDTKKYQQQKAPEVMNISPGMVIQSQD